MFGSRAQIGLAKQPLTSYFPARKPVSKSSGVLDFRIRTRDLGARRRVETSIQIGRSDGIARSAFVREQHERPPATGITTDVTASQMAEGLA